MSEITFGALPKTRILEGIPGKWSGQNSFFRGIKVYRVPNMAGIWAQEFWEWRLHAVWAAISIALLIAGTVAAQFLQSWYPMIVGLLGCGGAMVVGQGNRAAREIYSHALTLQAGLMLGLPVTEAEMVGSLTTYSYCRGIARDVLLRRLRAAYPKARAWCERNRGKIERLTQFG